MIAIIAHFDRHNRVDDYFLQLTREVLSVTEKCLVVSTCSLSKDECSKIQILGATVVCRENIGLDFLSWKYGLELMLEDLKGTDSLLLVNDSCYGPFFSLNKIFRTMDTKKHHLDIWGLTVSHENRRHLQSYFMVFRSKVLHSACFSNFWAGVEPLKDKDEIIRRYEIGLTTHFEQAGFKVGPVFQSPFCHSILLFISKLLRENHPLIISCFRKVFARLPRYQGNQTELSADNTTALKPSSIVRFFINFTRRNPTLFLWREMLQQQIPLLKVSLLRDNPDNVNIRDWEKEVVKISPAWLPLIKAHLERVKRE